MRKSTWVEVVFLVLYFDFFQMHMVVLSKHRFCFCLFLVFLIGIFVLFLVGKGLVKLFNHRNRTKYDLDV